MSGINAAVAANVPKCAEHVAPVAYHMAVRCKTYEQAYHQWLRKIEHLLPIPLVKPWERVAKDQKKVLATTSQYSQGGTASANLGRRATEASRSVDEFSDGAHEPEHDGMRWKFSTKKRAPRSKVRADKYIARRIPEEYVCRGCGRDLATGWKVLNGQIIQAVDHSKCGDPRMWARK